MQNKLYTIFSPPDEQLTASPQAAIAEPKTLRLCKIPEKDRTTRKVRTTRQQMIQTHGNKKSREPLGPWPTPIHKLSLMSMIWSISPGQLGCLSGCAPSQLPHTHSLNTRNRKQSLISQQQLKTSVLPTFFSY